MRAPCSFYRIVLFFVFLASVPLAAQNAASLPAPTIEKIEALILAEMKQQSIPGLSIAIVTDQQLRWSKGYGMADLENSVPASPATNYRIGSISKSITATAVMQLVERGKLDLDAPVQKYCPTYPKQRGPVTVRQLLSHMGGLRHFQAGDSGCRHYSSLAEAIETFKDDPLLFEPGTRFSYSGPGYNLLGCAIEGASQMPYADYVRAHIFEPAGMDRAGVDDAYQIIPNRAQGYRKVGGALRHSNLVDNSFRLSAGGLCATVADLAKFAIAVQTGRLVEKKTLDLMFARQKTRDGQEIDYGLGWGIAERKGQKEVGHHGSVARMSGMLFMLPEDRFAVALLVNLEGLSGGFAGSNLFDLSRRLADIVLGGNRRGSNTHTE